MNKKIYILIFILIWFILNIIFFMFSDNYRYFLQSLKYDNTPEYKVDDKYKISITDEYEEIVNENDLFSWLSNNFSDKSSAIDKNKELSNNSDKVKLGSIKINNNNWREDKKIEFLDSIEEIKLTDIENNILESLKKYNLKKIDLHPRLFGLTWEYPDDYFEYYADDINLYFFWNKLYSDMKDIFEVLTYELPFSLNEVNNFWEKSFYLNLNSWFDDENVRVILKKSNRIFWFKIKKELYNQMKNDLWVIFQK